MFTRFLDFFGGDNSSGLKGVLKRLHDDETGQGMTEYIIIIVLVAILVLVVVKLFGKKIKELFEGSTNKLKEAGTDAGLGS